MARSFSDLRGLTFPKLVNLLRHGTPVPIHGRQAMLFSVEIGAGSEIAGRSIAEVDDCRKRSAHGQKGFIGVSSLENKLRSQFATYSA
jgi:hypothetical protein